MGLPLIPGTTTSTLLGMCYTEKHKYMYYSNIQYSITPFEIIIEMLIKSS